MSWIDTDFEEPIPSWTTLRKPQKQSSSDSMNNYKFKEEVIIRKYYQTTKVVDEYEYELRQFVVDQTIPLSVRWDRYLNNSISKPILEANHYCMPRDFEFDYGGAFEIFTGFRVDGDSYQFTPVEYIIYDLENSVGESYEDVILTEEHIVEAKERIMRQGIYYLKY